MNVDFLKQYLINKMKEHWKIHLLNKKSDFQILLPAERNRVLSARAVKTETSLQV